VRFTGVVSEQYLVSQSPFPDNKSLKKIDGNSRATDTNGDRTQLPLSDGQVGVAVVRFACSTIQKRFMLSGQAPCRVASVRPSFVWCNGAKLAGG
jgi:hypothetical protein